MDKGSRQYLEHKLRWARKRLKDVQERQSEKPRENYYTYQGGWDMGFFEGTVETLEDIFEMLEKESEAQMKQLKNFVLNKRE